MESNSIKKALTPKERLFCKLFVGVCALNAARAYREARYEECDPVSSASRAHALMIKPHIKAEIERLQNAIEKKYDVKESFILKGITKIAKNRNAKHSDRLRAFELLGKFRGMWQDDKKGGTTTNNTQINIDTKATAGDAAAQLIRLGYGRDPGAMPSREEIAAAINTRISLPADADSKPALTECETLTPDPINDSSSVEPLENAPGCPRIDDNSPGDVVAPTDSDIDEDTTIYMKADFVPSLPSVRLSDVTRKADHQAYIEDDTVGPVACPDATPAQNIARLSRSYVKAARRSTRSHASNQQVSTPTAQAPVSMVGGASCGSTVPPTFSQPSFSNSSPNSLKELEL